VRSSGGAGAEPPRFGVEDEKEEEERTRVTSDGSIYDLLKRVSDVVEREGYTYTPREIF